MKVKYILRTTYYNFVTYSLLVKNLLFSKRLRVRDFLYTSKIVIRGNETELNWKTVGCHKISIKNLAVFPGNISYKNLKLDEKINEIEITFYGVGGQKEIKKIIIETILPSVLNNFSPKISISNLSGVPLVRTDLKSTLVNLFNYKVPKKIKLKNPKFISQNLKMSFEPFIKSNYLIKP
jgi:hypothetical protein